MFDRQPRFYSPLAESFRGISLVLRVYNPVTAAKYRARVARASETEERYNITIYQI